MTRSIAVSSVLISLRSSSVSLCLRLGHFRLAKVKWQTCLSLFARPLVFPRFSTFFHVLRVHHVSAPITSTCFPLTFLFHPSIASHPPFSLSLVEPSFETASIFVNFSSLVSFDNASNCYIFYAFRCSSFEISFVFYVFFFFFFFLFSLLDIRFVEYCSSIVRVSIRFIEIVWIFSYIFFPRYVWKVKLF